MKTRPNNPQTALNFMLNKVIHNVQAAYLTVFQETEKLLAKKTKSELKDLIHWASEIPADAPFSLRLAADTVKATAEKIMEDRK